MKYAFRISPSAIEKYRDCPYAWYLKYILGKQESKSDTTSTDLGSKLHTVAEHMLEGKTVPDELQELIPFVAPGLPFLTVKPEEVAIEDSLEHELNGVSVVGRIDFWTYSPNGILTVGDWKSCKNFSYAKKPNELASGVQPCMYAWLLVATGRCPQPKRIHFQHIYLNTTKPQAKSTLVTDVTWADVMKVIGEVAETLEKMKQDSQANDHEVDRHTASCWKYGGCRLAASCSSSPYKLKVKFPLPKKEDTDMSEVSWRPPVVPPPARMPSVNQDTIQKVLPSTPPRPPVPSQNVASAPGAGTRFIFLGTGPMFPRPDVQLLNLANANSGNHFTLPPLPLSKELEDIVLDLQTNKGYALVVAK